MDSCRSPVHNNLYSVTLTERLLVGGDLTSPGNLTSSDHFRKGLERFSEMPLLTEIDLRDLPAPVQRSLRYAGVVGKPKIKNFRAIFNGND
jgi:hypothetical protein